MKAGQDGKSRRYLFLFASLYAVQGVVVAYLTNFNKGYMIAAGVSERTAGWVETAALSLLVFKFVLGPISDRFSPFGWGHRRPYIILGLILLAGGFAGLTLFHPGTFILGYALTAVAAVGGMCLFDTTCDGMVIDVTSPEERSKVQGLLQLSRFLATMVCTTLFGLWLKRSGTGPGRGDGVILACAALVILPLYLAFTTREPEPAHDAGSFDARAFRMFAKRRPMLLLAFGALYGLVGLGVEFNLNRWYAALGYDADGNGIFGAIRYAGRAIGAILLPLVGMRLHRPTRLALGIVLLAVSTAGQAFVTGDTSAGAWALLFGIANGWNDALFCVMSMELSDPAMAASTYAVFMAASNVSIVGDALFIELANHLPGRFPTAFLLCSGLVASLLLFVPALGRKPEPATAGNPA